MPLISIPIVGLTLSFRKLTYREECALDFPDTEDVLRIRLAAAMVEVSRPGNLPFAPDCPAALTILRSLPRTLLEHVWKTYRVESVPDRVFTTVGLFQAPDAVSHRERVFSDEAAQEAQEAVLDPTLDQIAKREDAESIDRIQRTVFEDAKRRNVLQPVKQGEPPRV